MFKYLIIAVKLGLSNFKITDKYPPLNKGRSKKNAVGVRSTHPYKRYQLHYSNLYRV